MSTDSRQHWFIRDVVPGDVTIREPGGDDSFPFRATVVVTATIINGCGGRSEVRFDAFAGFVDPENIGDVVTLVVEGGIKGARKAARAYCDAANAAHDWAIRNDPAARLDARSRGEIAPNCAGA